MRTTGHKTRTAAAALFLFLTMTQAGAASEASPQQTAAPHPRRLGDLAILIHLKAADEDRREGTIVITNDTVVRHDEKGMLSVAGAATTEIEPGVDEVDRREVDKQRQKWRKKVDSQRQRIARTEHEIVILEGKIKALSNAAFDAGHSSRKAINAWARLESEKSKLANLTARLKQEKQTMNGIIREARRDGAQPGWFR